MSHPRAASSFPATDLRDALAQGLRQLGLPLSDRQSESLLAYLDLIQKWNKVYNLTALRDPQDMLAQHLLDSLSVVHPVREHAPTARRVLDVGSGAGLPGVVLALARPDLEVVCLDAVAKKAAFIQQVAGALDLPNLRAMHARIEDLRTGEGQGWDLVCSRAFASLADFVSGSVKALAPGGVWMAMKGKTPQQEIAALPADMEVFHVEQLQVPRLDARRCIVWMRRRWAQRPS